MNKNSAAGSKRGSPPHGHAAGGAPVRATEACFSNPLGDHARTGVCVIRIADGLICDANRSFEKMFGFGPGKMTGKSFAGILNAPGQKGPERVAVEIAEGIKKDGVWHGEIHYVRRDGTNFWGCARVIPFEHKRHGPVWISVHADAGERKLIRDELQRRSHDLGERVKELGCLYGISKLVDEHGHALEEIFQGTVNRVPPAWQYPDITHARILFAGREFRTAAFRTARWCQAAEIRADKEIRGKLEVYYTEKRPESYEGPFLKEERFLIDAIAKQLGKIIERAQAEEKLRRHIHDLSERIKELNCLYGLSKLVERHGDSLKEIFQGLVGLIPPAWQYPEITCARLEVGNQTFQTGNFKGTIWRQSSDILVFDKPVGALHVFYLEERPESDEGVFLKEERSLINAIGEWLGKVIERQRTQEALKESEAQLQEQKTALAKKNVALQEILAQIELEKKLMRDNIAVNVEALLLPLVEKLRLKGASRKYVRLLKQNLYELTSSFGRKISEKENKLTPKETEICDMIRHGLTCKEMAGLLNIASGTVEVHRINIRKKLGIANKDINLASYLKTL